MFEAFFQVQKRMMLMNALQPDKNNPVDLESLSGKNKRDREHLEKFKAFKKWQESRNENSKC